MVHFWRYPSGKLCLTLLALVVIFDLIAARFFAIEVPLSNFIGVLLVAVLFTFTWAIGEVCQRRLPKGAQRLGTGIMNVSVSLVFYCVWNTSCLFATYYAAAFQMPLQDEALASVDRFFGFDWLAFLEWVNASTAASYVLCYAYLSMIPQMLFAIVLFAFSKHSEMVWDFFALCAVTLVATTILAGAFPALAAYVHYAPAPSAYSFLETIIPDVGRDYIPHVTALHQGTLTEFDITSMKGIISFPSYHAIVGLILIYTAMQFRLFVVPAILLNGALIVATIPVGGHHMADTIGSVAVFGLGLAVVHRRRIAEALGRVRGSLAPATPANSSLARV